MVNDSRQTDTPLVISASRRTDLVSCYPEYLVEKLSHYPPEKVHTVVLWTKNPANLITPGPLRECLLRYTQLYVHLTITGLGGTMLEPKIPDWKTVVDMLPGILELTGSAERISWRFDPIIRAVTAGSVITNIDLFPLIAQHIKHSGVTVCRTSWVEPYKKVLRRLEKKAITLVPYSYNEKAGQMQLLEKTAAAMSLKIHYCSSEGCPRSQCIDGRLLSRLRPDHAVCSFRKAKGQRTMCGCTESVDVGWYSLKCGNGCLYCYAEPLVA